MKNGRVHLMGQFDAPRRVDKLHFCHHCGKPVGQTILNLGYCKECLEIARQENIKEK